MADEPTSDLDDTPLDMDDAAAAIEGLQDAPESDIEQPQVEGDADEAEPEIEVDEEGEPAQPAIAPPASLTAEEKAGFAQLPPEAQRMLADVETRRARQVSEATTNALNAQRKAASDAVQAKSNFAQQLHTFVAAYQPRQPNPADYGNDMQAFARDDAQYRYALSEHHGLVQQVQSIGAEARGEADQHMAERAQEEQRKLQGSLPDWFDAEKGPKLKEDLTAIGSELGYAPELMAQADASDILALKKALGWKRDSERLKAIMDRQMQGVRAAKKTAPAGVTQPQGTGRRQAGRDAMAKVAKSGSLDDGAAAIAALGF